MIVDALLATLAAGVRGPDVVFRRDSLPLSRLLKYLCLVEFAVLALVVVELIDRLFLLIELLCGIVW